MDECIKIEFIDDEHFIIYYVSEEIFRNEEEIKLFFKLLNNNLKSKCNYSFEGFYEVVVYCNQGIYILDFNYVDDLSFGRTDFDITMLLNSIMLYEIEDIDLFNYDKVYYKEKYYIELENVIDDIHLFEYGNIIYGEEVNEILENGIIIKKS